jgi:hypothetical protein
MSVIQYTVERNAWQIFAYTILAATLILGLAALISVLKQNGIEIVHSDFGKSLIRQYIWLREALLDSALSYALNMLDAESRGRIANFLVISTAISVGLSVVVYIPWIRNNSAFIKEIEVVFPPLRPIYIMVSFFATLIYAAMFVICMAGIMYSLYSFKWEPVALGVAFYMIAFGLAFVPLMLFRGFLYWLSTGSESVLRFFDDEKNQTAMYIWQSIPVLLLCMIFTTSLLVVVASVDWVIANAVQSAAQP